MANNFTRQEQVVFDAMIDGFDDSLVIAKSARLYNPFENGESAERAGDRFWVPAPLISASYDGFDQTSNFGDIVEQEVPVSIGYHKSVPNKLTAKNLRNESVLREKARSAKQKLASDINYALYQRVAIEGAVTVKRTGAATGFDDVSLADAALTEIGVPGGDRRFFASPRTANLMAGNLASRATDNKRDADAYARAMLSSDVAGFEVFKNDQSIRLTAATGGAILINGANQYYTPKATTTDTLGEVVNVDNRYSDLIVDGGTYANIKAGDRFTIAGVNSVHMITKNDTGQLQTFTVVSKPAANTIRVAPAIISGGGSTRAELEYQNVTATPANDAALTWLNTTVADTNVFFVRGALLLVPGTFTVDPQDGWQVLRATTDLGVAITYTRQGEINDLTVKTRWDIDFGTSLLNPQFAGIELFGQA
jgi:hypothetical protein